MVGALVSVNDCCGREARILSPEDVLDTGKHRFRYYATPHLPHGWDAGVLFEETDATLLCSDLFTHNGEVEPLTNISIVDRASETLAQFEAGPFASYVPWTQNSARILDGLASLNPKTLAVMHGSSFTGNCAQALRELGNVMKQQLDKPSYQFRVTAA
jgi:hypothetical protein